MKAKLVHTGKNIALNTPQFFFAQNRQLANEAYAGDVVGLIGKVNEIDKWASLARRPFNLWS